MKPSADNLHWPSVRLTRKLRAPELRSLCAYAAIYKYLKPGMKSLGESKSPLASSG